MLKTVQIICVSENTAADVMSSINDPHSNEVNVLRLALVIKQQYRKYSEVLRYISVLC